MESTVSKLQEQPAFRLTEDWIIWLEHNLGHMVPADAIAAAMIEKGCAPELARGLTEAFTLRRGPGSSAAMTPRLAKTKWLLDTLRQLQRLSLPRPVAERRIIDRDEFYGQFYARNFPVVYRDSLVPRELSELLSWERLEREFGTMEVEVQEGRSRTTDFERRSGSLKSKCNLAEFLRRAREAIDSNDFYMTANNSTSNAGLIETALDPGGVCPELLDRASAKGRVFLWIGPRGTFTPAHHDLTNNLFLQIKGAKEFRLVSSFALLEVDNDQHCYLSSSLTDIDARRAEEGRPTLSFTGTLEEGDMLFIPLGWWHEVRGLSASISLSATNFQESNEFFKSYEFYGRLDT